MQIPFALLLAALRSSVFTPHLTPMLSLELRPSWTTSKIRSLSGRGRDTAVSQNTAVVITDCVLITSRSTASSGTSVKADFLSTVNSWVVLGNPYWVCLLVSKSTTNIRNQQFKIQTYFTKIHTNYVEVIFARRQRITHVILHIFLSSRRPC